MKLWRRTPHNQKAGLLIEVGSGSILAAIVVSDDNFSHPNIVWTKREYASLSNKFDFEHNIKNILTLLMNSMIAADSEGRRELQNSYPNLNITTIQVAISAPWAYTISKIAEFEQDTTFTITNALINNLIEKAGEHTNLVLKESEKIHNTGLTIMTRATTDITANGYHTMTPIGQTASVVTLTEVTAIAEKLITNAIDDLKHKVFSGAKLERYSTMLVFHSVIKDLYQDMTEYCLVDLSYEATEIAIVREGVLQYTTHTDIGVNTLIRNLANRLNTPEGDAVSVFKKIYSTDNIESLTENEKSALNSLMSEYQTALESLFHETGDSLAIPKVLFLHCDYLQERFFDDYLINAAKSATSSSHTVHTLSHDIMLRNYTGDSKIRLIKQNIDTGILMHAQFFHKQEETPEFTQI